METVIIVIAAVLAVVVVGALVGYLRTTSGRRVKPQVEQPEAQRPPVEQAAPPAVSAPTPAPATTAPATRAPTPEAPAAPAPLLLDVPEPTAGRLVRLRGRLARSNSAVGKGLLTLLSRDKLDEDTWQEIEDVLLTSDVGVAPTQELVERLRTRVRVLGSRTPDDLRALLREELIALIGPAADRTVHSVRADGEGPAVVLVVGVNGVGKTTTTGKLARVLVADGRSVVLGAADTFRAAAADQLETWGRRVGATTVRGPEGADPASVAFDAVKKAKETGVDTALIDTAGRLHTKVGLMDELGKVKRVVEKHGPVDEVLLVLDATTGQNGMVQARVFREVVDISGIVLTKLDGTAKGGIVIAVQRELGV
ncbi:MAG TPA: signal recognition particle-docking protein FtsY, partial [Actinocrinis sp.]|uniref:signal recognition particle-docking protein FtsY n=1 Tax=Actinocrinis sp. TaxID=1920516 RepID=UPI002DDDA9F4